MKYFILIISTSILFCCGNGESTAKNGFDNHEKLDSKIPKAKMRDTELEKELVDYFNSIGWQEKFFAAVIVSDEWNYKKSHSGIITNRTLPVLMVSQKPDGTCMYQDFTVIQQKTPDGFGKSKRYGTGGQVDCSCGGISEN